MNTYTRRSNDRLTWVRYDDSDHWVVNFPAAAQTHLLTASAACLWHLVPEDGAASAQDLARLLASDLGVDASEALIRSTEETLAFFDAMGLVDVASL